MSELVGVSAHADSLALSLSARRHGRGISAVRYDVASGGVLPVAVLPSGVVTTQTSWAQGMTDAGDVLFASLNKRLGGGASDVPGFSLLLATIR